MDRQTLLAFLLIGGILMVWLYFNNPQPQPAKPDTVKKSVVADSAAIAAKQIEQAKQQQEEIKEDTTGSTRMFPAMSRAEEIVTVSNELVQYEVTNKGAKYNKVYLKQYNNWFVPTGKVGVNHDDWVQLLNTKKGNSMNLQFIANDGKKISTTNLAFKSDAKYYNYDLKGTDSLVLTYTYTAEKKSIIITHTFFGNKYDSRYTVKLVGFTDYVTGNSVDFAWDAGIRAVEKNTADEANYSNSSVYYGGEQVKIDAPLDGNHVSQDFNGKVDWACVRNKYFAAIIEPQKPQELEGAFVKGYAQHYNEGGVKEFYSVRYKLPLKSESFEHTFRLYLGPVKYSILDDYNNHFIDIVDFGSFFGLKFIVRPIAEYVFLPLFTFLHEFIPNYGWVIVIFSLIIKILLHPLSKTSLKSMQKMQLLQPKMQEVREKFKDDPTKMNKEVMALYSTYGINPMGGCLPMILQMPIFIALWGLFQTAVELRHQPFMWWITDLSAPDTILSLPFKIPLFGVSEISALALLMGITMFIQQKMSVKDPQQQAMVYIMPVMFVFIFMSFPAGLNLYYFLFNLFSIAQQYYITHHLKGVTLEPVKNTKKKKGFMERMMEAAEQKTKSQQGKKKN